MAPRKRTARAKSTPAKKPARKRPAAKPAKKISREKSPPGGSVVAQRKQAAELLGITDRQLGTWAKEDWFPPDGRTKDGWDVAAIRAAQPAGRKGSDESKRAKRLERALRRERIKKFRLENEKLRRQEDEAQGNILPRDEWQLFAGEAITIARDRLLAIPKALAKLVPTAHRKALKAEGEREVRKILQSLAAVLQKGPTD